MAIRADASSLRRLGMQFRAIAPKAYAATRKEMKSFGDRVADDAASNASAWSTRIPGTVKASTSGGTAVIVRAGGQDAPHAKAYEHAGSGGTFRHPVFGDRKAWVSENARPFLHPAATAHLQEGAETLAAALTSAVEATKGDV